MLKNSRRLSYLPDKQQIMIISRARIIQPKFIQEAINLNRVLSDQTSHTRTASMARQLGGKPPQAAHHFDHSLAGVFHLGVGSEPPH